jgi:acyl-CoA reductase-like NAD-dependent aldehyde dehydrogenase
MRGRRLVAEEARRWCLRRFGFFKTTIIERPSQKTTIAEMALFGPVRTVLCFRTEEEVVAFANESA